MIEPRDRVELALTNAAAALERGQRPAATAWLLAAADECGSWLREQAPDAVRWPSTRAFMTACLVGVQQGRVPYWRDRLPRAVREARAAFSVVIDELAAVEAPPGMEAAVAVALEDLLDTVWRCEAEWRFDDRLAMVR